MHDCVRNRGKRLRLLSCIEQGICRAEVEKATCLLMLMDGEAEWPSDWYELYEWRSMVQEMDGLWVRKLSGRDSGAHDSSWLLAFVGDDHENCCVHERRTIRADRWSYVGLGE